MTTKIKTCIVNIWRLFGLNELKITNIGGRLCKHEDMTKLNLGTNYIHLVRFLIDNTKWINMNHFRGDPTLIHELNHNLLPYTYSHVCLYITLLANPEEDTLGKQ